MDITLASPSISRFVVNWKVLVEFESLSDHPYISFGLERPASHLKPARRYSPRWLARSMDTEIFREALEWACSNRPPWTQPGDGPRGSKIQCQRLVMPLCADLLPCPVDLTRFGGTMTSRRPGEPLLGRDGLGSELGALPP